MSLVREWCTLCGDDSVVETLELRVFVVNDDGLVCSTCENDCNYNGPFEELQPQSRFNDS